MPEPFNPQSLNRYSYCLNNPIKYTDSSGHWVDLGGGLGVRYAPNGAPVVLFGGQVFRNQAEVAQANIMLNAIFLKKYGTKLELATYACNPATYDNLQVFNASIAHRSLNAACYGVEGGSGDQMLDIMLDAGVIAGIAKIGGDAVNDGLAWAMQGLGESAQSYVQRLQIGNSGAHAWGKHGPGASMGALYNRSLQSGAPQTRFTSAGEMASAIQNVVSAYGAEIQSQTDSGFKGTVAYNGPSVTYNGYLNGGYISGSAPARVVFEFDGEGGWSLLTAYPQIPQ